MTILSYVWVVSMYLSSIYLSLPDEPCWKPQLQQRRRTAEAESGLQNPQILWDQFTSPSSMGAHGRMGKRGIQSLLWFTGQGTSLRVQMHAAVVDALARRLPQHDSEHSHV